MSGKLAEICTVTLLINVGSIFLRSLLRCFRFNSEITKGFQENSIQSAYPKTFKEFKERFESLFTFATVI